jgi:DNA-binding transcriptional regulator YiaG
MAVKRTAKNRWSHEKIRRLESGARTNLGKALRQAAKDIGLTQQYISERTGRSTRTVARWCSGETSIDLAAIAVHMPRLFRGLLACLKNLDHNRIGGWLNHD